MSSFNCQSFSKIDHDLRARRQFECLSRPAKAIQLDGLSLLADSLTSFQHGGAHRRLLSVCLYNDFNRFIDQISSYYFIL